MAEWHVLASGPSMSQQLADSLRGKRAAVVSNCYELAPWADVLVSQDVAWWQAHPRALQFAGRKFSTHGTIEGVERFSPQETVKNYFSTGCNSGLIACLVVQWLGATRICLHGFDLHGTHYFGEHKSPLRNPTADRFRGMCREFQLWRHPGVDVVNMTPGSALTCFPVEEYKC